VQKGEEDMPYIMTLLSLFVSDSFIKAYIEKNKNPGMAEPLLNGKIIIKRTHNTGAMLNLGEGKQHYIALLSLVFSAFVSGIFAATFGSKKKKMLKTGLALILGGAYSNTYDRLKRKYVVDYVSFGMYPKIVFNLADFGIIIGSVLFVLSELCKKEENLKL